ncbi:MAG: DUF4389 domain-containing protein [Gammaproteobacteria bacterium]|nr:DUF4389 domain-containing protein [Gammaproteobacteria bacterium]MBU1623592.1 DUF4389 domain-containing protein [Gammaproteobacteria bacterium]
MDEITKPSGEKRNIWMRGLFMLLMGLAFQVSGTVLFIVTVIQFVIVLMSDAPNERLVSFGRSLAAYLQQTVRYLTFVSEEVPFPFSEWPAAES